MKPINYEISTPDCHPELPRGQEYHSVRAFSNGAMSFEEGMFMYGLVLGCKPDIVLETGCETGCSTVHIATALKDQGFGKLYSIELDSNYIGITNNNLCHFDVKDFAEVVQGDSINFLTNFSVDQSKHYLVFLDTSISIRVQEYNIIKSKFPKGTVVAIHDTSPNHPMGNMELEKNTGDQWFHLPSPRGLSITTIRTNYVPSFLERTLIAESLSSVNTPKG